MSTSRPRVSVTLDNDLSVWARHLARRKGVSLSKVLLEKIQEAREWEETFEILRDRSLMESIQRGLEDIQAGRVKPWRSILKDAV